MVGKYQKKLETSRQTEGRRHRGVKLVLLRRWSTLRGRRCVKTDARLPVWPVCVGAERVSVCCERVRDGLGSRGVDKY